MSLARWVRNNYCFKESVFSICKSLKWDIPAQQILKSATIFAHTTQQSRKPKQIVGKIRFPRARGKATLRLKYPSKNEKYNKNRIVQSIRIYNLIPEEIKLLPLKKFNAAIKKIWIREDQVWKRLTLEVREWGAGGKFRGAAWCQDILQKYVMN